MWLSRFRNRTSGPRRLPQPASKFRRTRLLLERLEDRTVPANFTASTVAQLIADINAANAAGGSNTIVLAANTTFDLTAVNNTTNGANGLPVIAAKDSLTITGQGGDVIQRDTAAPAFRLFDVASYASLTLTNLTVQNGLALGSGSSAEGGALYNQGSLALNSVTVQSNSAQGSNGVRSKNKPQNHDNGQDASGGGIWSSGTLTVAGGTVIQGNQAVGGSGAPSTDAAGGNAFGGGLFIAGGKASLTRFTLENNAAKAGSGGNSINYVNPIPGPGGPGGSAYGGALAVLGGSVTLTNGLLENDSVMGGPGGTGFPGGAGNNGVGGGLYAGSGATVALCGDTLEFNEVSGGLGATNGQGRGGGLFMDPKAALYLDSVTLANTLNNTDSSGTNGSTANIDGSYVLRNC
jgi:hypothetical protein